MILAWASPFNEDDALKIFVRIVHYFPHYSSKTHIE